MGTVETESPISARRALYVVDQPGRTSKSVTAKEHLARFDRSISLMESIESFLPAQRNRLILAIEAAAMIRQFASLPRDMPEPERQRIIEERVRMVVEALVRNGVIRFR